MWWLAALGRLVGAKEIVLGQVLAPALLHRGDESAHRLGCETLEWGAVRALGGPVLLVTAIASGSSWNSNRFTKRSWINVVSVMEAAYRPASSKRMLGVGLG